MPKQKIKSNIYAYFSLVLLTLTYLLSLRSKIKISFDGTLYLISAKALFTSDMSSMYQWIREPGYPLFIKLFLNEKFYFQKLIFAQSLFIAISIIVVFSYFISNSKKSKINSTLYFIAGIISFLSIYGYSNWVLQQFLFIFLTSLHVLYLWIIDTKNLKINQLIFFSAIVLLLTALVSIILLPASAFVILFSSYKYLRKIKKLDTKSKVPIFLAIIFPALIFTSSWNIYKSNEIQNTDRLYSDPYSDKPLISDYANFSIEEVIYNAPARLGGILGITNEFLPGIKFLPPANNHFYYAFNNFHGGLNCGVLDGGPSSVQEKLKLNEINFAECNDSELLKNFYYLTNSVTNFFPAFLCLAYVLLIVGLFDKNKVFINVTIFPLLSIVPYIFGSASISRYGSHLIFLTPFVIAFYLEKFLSFQKKDLV